MTPEFLNIEDVLEIHAMQIARYGGGDGLRDQGLLESARNTDALPAEAIEILDVESLKARAKLYQQARLDHPERWSRNTRD